MKKEFNNLSTFEYLGEFWIPNNKQKKFPGLLCYSPTSGIILETLLINNKIDIPSSKKIFGIVEKLGKVTLLEPVQKTGVTTTGNSNHVAHYQFFILYLIMGVHLNRSTNLNRATVTFSHLDEFCFPQSKSHLDKFKQPLVFSCDLKSESDMIAGAINLKKAASGSFIPKRPSDLFVLKTDDKKTKDALDKTINNILSQYDGDAFLKKKIHYYFEIIPNVSNADNLKFYDEVFQYLKSMLRLFMLDHCVVLQDITFYNDNKKLSFTALKSFYLSNNELNKIQTDNRLYNFQVPVNLSVIANNPESIVNQLFEVFRNRTDIVDTLLNHLSSKVDPKQHFVMLMAAFERWGILEKRERGEKLKNTEKYEWILNKYATPYIKRELFEYIPKIPKRKKLSIDVFLSELRNTVVHPSKLDDKQSKYLTPIINSTAINNINEYLFLTLYIALLLKIGISKETMHDFYDRHDWFISKTESYTLS